MFPGLSFHDATLAAVTRRGNALELKIDDVTCEVGGPVSLSAYNLDGRWWDLCSGTVTLSEVRSISVNDSPAEHIMMARERGSILSLDRRADGFVVLSVTWLAPGQSGPAESECSRYDMDCGEARWTPSGPLAAPPPARTSRFAPLILNEVFTTPASPAFVWAALESAPRWPEVLPDIAEAKIAPLGRLESGATIRSRANPGGRAIDMIYRIEACEPPHRLVIASEGKGFCAQTSYWIEDTGGSRLSVHSRIVARRLWPRISLVIRRRQHFAQMSSNMRLRTQALLLLAERISQEKPWI